MDLAEVLGSLRELFDRDLLEYATLRNGSTGERGLYALPMGRITHHIHVWQSLLERAGFTLADIPEDSSWRAWRSVRSAAGRSASPNRGVLNFAVFKSILFGGRIHD